MQLCKLHVAATASTGLKSSMFHTFANDAGTRVDQGMPWSVAQGELTVQAQRLHECRRMRPRAAGRKGGRPRGGAARTAGPGSARTGNARRLQPLCRPSLSPCRRGKSAAQPCSPARVSAISGKGPSWHPQTLEASATPGQVKKRNCCMQAAAHLSRAGFRRVTPSQVKEINW